MQAYDETNHPYTKVARAGRARDATDMRQTSIHPRAERPGHLCCSCAYHLPTTTCSMNDSIVITGIGILSPLGIGAEETAAAWREAETALQPCTRFALPPGLPSLCGEVPEFRIEDFQVSPKAYLDRNSELLLAATGMALHNAGLDTARLTPERTGILVGTAWAGQDTMTAFFADYVQKGARLVKPFLFPHAYFNTAISLAAMEWSFRGVHQAFASGRIASGQAIIAACDLLADHEADVILAGGCEALSPVLFHVLAAHGIPPGEAGVMLVLERQSHAKTRGAKVLATLCGTGVAHSANEATRQALQQAGMLTNDLALVVASNPDAETLAHTPLSATLDTCHCLAPSTLCGDTQGACTALGLALAVLHSAGPTLVLTTDAAGKAVAMVVQRR